MVDVLVPLRAFTAVVKDRVRPTGFMCRRGRVSAEILK